MAIAEVVPPNICRAVDTIFGIFSPKIDNKIPKKIERIKGFFESLFATSFKPLHTEASFNLYISSIAIDVGTAINEIEAADNVAKFSLCLVGNANITNGIPKKATDPKMVLKINNKRTSFFNLIIFEKIMITQSATNIGRIPE